MTLTAGLQKRLKRIRTLSNKITKENFYGIKTNHNGHNGQFKRIMSSSYHHNFTKKKKIVVRSILGTFLRVVD